MGTRGKGGSGILPLASRGWKPLPHFFNIQAWEREKEHLQPASHQTRRAQRCYYFDFQQDTLENQKLPNQ
jgi:hypothetical protein